MKEIDLLTFKRITIMKKQYILPSTTTVAFQVAGLICAGSPTRTVRGGTLGGGGLAPGGVEPM